MRGGQILECGAVFYQEEEPDNGTSNYIAWWQPSNGKWQFKSNETGNVFREAIACRLAHVHTDGTTITRIDYIGNRILDDEIFVEKDKIPNFIPANTIITVKTDNTGDFTKLSDAINYLTGKYSNGTVTILLGEGTFEEDNPVVIDTTKCNLTLVITGQGDSSIINYANLSSTNYYVIKILNSNNVYLRNFVIKTTSTATSGNNITISHSSVQISDCTITRTTKTSNGISLDSNSMLYCYNTKISNFDSGIVCRRGGIATVTSTVTFTNVVNKTSFSKGTLFEV